MSRITAAALPVHGTAAAPPSKSAAHRALLCAALAGGGTVVGISDSEDMRATGEAIRALGLHLYRQGDTVMVTGGDQPNGDSPVLVNCRESGSTLRFLIPVFAARGISSVFTGCGRLPGRPLGVYADCLPRHGVVFQPQSELSLPLSISGKLQAGRYELPGNVSSQFISGLLFALPLCEGDSEIVLTTPLESAAYVEMTTDVMQEAGVAVERTQHGWNIGGGQKYRLREYRVEGDWSQAAFLLAMGALGGKMTVTGLKRDSGQGDREIVSLMQRFGADIRTDGDTVVSNKSTLHGIDIDASQVPDLVPVLAVLGALAKGTTVITGAARLRLKESDRLYAAAHCLNQLGGCVKETPDGLRIEGTGHLHGGVTVPGFNDHRIVMSMAVAALGCEQPITIEDAESVAKSWPDFFEIYTSVLLQKKC